MSDQFLTIRLESDHLPASVKVTGFEGTEAISAPFELTIRFYCPDGALVTGQDLLGESITVVWDRAGIPQRRMHGTIAEVQDFAVTGDGNNAWVVKFVPRVWILSQNYKTDVFLYLTVPEILAEVLRRQGFEDDKDFEFRLNTRYSRREFTVQYKETDLAFVSRLAEHYGICFFFEHDGDREKLVFADHNNFFRPVPESDVVEWVERDTVQGVQALEVTTRIVPENYQLRDYNYRTPGLKLDAESEIVKTGGGGTVYEHGDHFKSTAEAAQFARVRAEEIRCQRQVFSGRSNVPQLLSGATFTIVEHPRGDFALLLTQVTHHYSAGTSHAAEGDNASTAYHSDWTALLKSIQFRPERVTPRPRIAGLLTAFVEDVSRENVHAMLDDHGRYRVRFVYDQTPNAPGAASHPVRMAQPHVGIGYGMHFPLRQGREVVLSFIDGDPDRPIIVGGVPNPVTMSPTGALNNVESRLRSGGGNELRMNDTSEQQRLILEAPHLKSFIQLGAREHPETGFLAQTEGHQTHVAWRSQNNVTRWSRDMVEQKSVHAARSVVMTAGISLPGTTQGSQPLQFDQMLDGVRDALVDVKQVLATLDGRKLASLQQQMDHATMRRDGALDDVVATHPELDEDKDDDDDDASSASADSSDADAGGGDATGSSDADDPGGAPPPGASGSIGDRIRQAREVELAALGMANGFAQEAEETFSDFAKRIDGLRRLPLFGQEKHVAAALTKLSDGARKGASLAQKASDAIGKVETESGKLVDAAQKAVQAVESVAQIDITQIFKKPERAKGESDAAYRKRIAAAYAQAARELAAKNAGFKPDEPPEGENFPDASGAEEMSDEQAAAVGKTLVSQSRMDATQRDKLKQDPPNEEDKKESVKRYERAANQVDRVRNRVAEYWTALKDHPGSLFRETAEKLLADVAERGEGEWGWGDLGLVYSTVTDTLQRSRLGSLLQNAEHISITSGSRMPRESDEILHHTDDADGMLIHSARKTAAVLGEDAVLGGERAATVTARHAVNLVSGSNAYVHANTTAEISANSSVALSSHHHVDVQADDYVTVIAHPRGAERGTDEESIPHYHSMLLRSRKSVLFDSVRGSIHVTALEPRPSESEPEDKEKGNVTVDAGHEVLVTAKKKVAITSAEDDVIVTTVKQKIRLHALEEAMLLTSKKDMTQQTEAAYALSGKTVASKSENDTTIEAGQNVNVKGGSQINLQAGTINVKGKLYLG